MVSAESKKDKRTVEDIQAEIRAKKRMKLAQEDHSQEEDDEWNYYLFYWNHLFLNLPHLVGTNSDLFKIFAQKVFFFDRFTRVSMLVPGSFLSKSSTINCLKYISTLLLYEPKVLILMELEIIQFYHGLACWSRVLVIGCQGWRRRRQISNNC